MQKKIKKRKSKKSGQVRSPKKKGDLLSQVVRLSGLPKQLVSKELSSILEKKNFDPKKLTLDQLRQVAASYVREIMYHLLDHVHPNKQKG